MRSYRGILTVLVLAALLVSAGIAAIRLFYPPLPHPAEANREELIRWLVVRDLGAEPVEIRQALASRLEGEFGAGLDWDAMGERLDQSQRKRVWDNILLLLEPWFLQKTDQFFKLATADQPAYLDQLLDTINVWRGFDSLRPKQSETPEKPGRQLGLVDSLFDRVEQWKEQAEPQRRQRIGQFANAIQARWLLRNLRQLLPSP